MRGKARMGWLVVAFREVALTTTKDAGAGNWPRKS